LQGWRNGGEVNAVAWMRIMGRESVEYHRATVIERGDDYPGRALAYYASRGETPLGWGGTGAGALCLQGPVRPEAYEAVFGPGGAHHPQSGQRLVATQRPGMELVISAHKSVAELGVIGRAEHMHTIMDAERDATLAYLDRVTRQMGGRRGRTQVVTETGGLVYAHTRHATSRAGDPCPHDHVLLANVVEMLDERGGWKAPDTALWREHLHAATMVGRAAAARVAAELGYGIEPDPGPSGRLGHWRIAGVPGEVIEVHSKRSAEITTECKRRGESSYRARSVAARATRRAKEAAGVEGQLVERWRRELAGIGWPIERLAACIDASAAARQIPRMKLTEARKLLSEVLGPDSDLARRKIFFRRDVIVTIAPHVYGQDPRLVEALADRALADPETLPLVGLQGARERPYTLASVVAREVAIADCLSRQIDRGDAPVVPSWGVEQAIAAVEAGLDGGSLSEEQRQTVQSICTSRRGAELVVGVAGAGKTTMLRAVATAFGDSGYQVYGTATSGQAACNLGAEAEIDQSRTLASLIWWVDHGQLSLDDRTVVVCDEVGMTDDIDLAPSAAGDAGLRRWLGRSQRLLCTADEAHWRTQAAFATDMRPALPSVQAPTLFVYRQGLRGAALYRNDAEQVRGARVVELPGEDRLFFVGDTGPMLDAIEEFLTGQLPAHQSDGVLATVLYTDIVGSTEHATRLGDRRWRDLLVTHDAVVRAEVLRFRGELVKTTGDGVLATFDGPGRAIRCSCAIRDSARTLGVDVRAGLHTGEIELIGDDVAGIALHIGARVLARASDGEVLVSSTVKDLVAGSGINFIERGEHELKGVPGTWRLFAVEG
jgi:conjugative relaxase-like TrwC/TraI family protein